MIYVCVGRKEEGKGVGWGGDGSGVEKGRTVQKIRRNLGKEVGTHHRNREKREQVWMGNV